MDHFLKSVKDIERHEGKRATTGLTVLHLEMMILDVFMGMDNSIIIPYATLFVQCRVKPIFHCDAKYLVSGVGVGQCLRRQHFALGIATCWYLKCENLRYRTPNP